MSLGGIAFERHLEKRLRSHTVIAICVQSLTPQRGSVAFLGSHADHSDPSTMSSYLRLEFNISERFRTFTKRKIQRTFRFCISQTKFYYSGYLKFSSTNFKTDSSSYFYSACRQIREKELHPLELLAISCYVSNCSLGKDLYECTAKETKSSFCTS